MSAEGCSRYISCSIRGLQRSNVPISRPFPVDLDPQVAIGDQLIDQRVTCCRSNRVISRTSALARGGCPPVARVRRMSRIRDSRLPRLTKRGRGKASTRQGCRVAGSWWRILSGVIPPTPPMAADLNSIRIRLDQSGPACDSPHCGEIGERFAEPRRPDRSVLEMVEPLASGLSRVVRHDPASHAIQRYRGRPVSAVSAGGVGRRGHAEVCPDTQLVHHGNCDRYRDASHGLAPSSPMRQRSPRQYSSSQLASLCGSRRRRNVDVPGRSQATIADG